MKDSYIEQLRNLINKEEGTSFTFDDVETYVGSDTATDDILLMLEETEDGTNPVTASDIEGLLEDDYITLKERVAGILFEDNELPESYESPSEEHCHMLAELIIKTIKG